METSAWRIEELNVPRDRESSFETKLFGRKDSRERINREFKMVMCNKSSPPTPDGAIKLMHLKIKDLEKRHSGRKMHNFDKAPFPLEETMDERYTNKLQAQFT